VTRTILHATDAGAPVYGRVGYRRTARFLTIQPAGEAGGQSALPLDRAAGQAGDDVALASRKKAIAGARVG